MELFSAYYIIYVLIVARSLMLIYANNACILRLITGSHDELWICDYYVLQHSLNLATFLLKLKFLSP